MQPKKLTDQLSVTPQISAADIATLAAQGFRSVINNRPDGEADEQPTSESLQAAARAAGLDYRHIPIVPGQLQDAQIVEFAKALDDMPGPVLAFCRTGTRSTTLWALQASRTQDIDGLLQTAAGAGYDLTALRPRMAQLKQSAAAPAPAPESAVSRTVQVLIVGGGSGGCAVAASLRKREPSLDITLIEPKAKNYYQSAWTLVGRGIYDVERTGKPMTDVLPAGVVWEQASVASFEPESNSVTLSDGRRIGYHYLVVSPGIALRFDRIEGVADTLGRNGVTSNYRMDLAPYTWKLVSELKQGRALFTQPPMPIKCAGAPQKAMYLSCDHWFREGLTGAIDVQFHNAGGVLFGVSAFVPTLMEYVNKYQAKLNFNSNLVGVDGPARKAWFEDKIVDDGSKALPPAFTSSACEWRETRTAGGAVTREGTLRRGVEFDMIHVVPPQSAPEFVRNSSLVDAAGWVSVNQETLRHTRYENIFSLGDVCSTPNSKTGAAVRMQAPIVAENLLSVMHGRNKHAVYNGYGACPLTVEKGRVVLAEFGYGGKLLPSFPMDPTKASRLAWLLKTEVLPRMYFYGTLRGHEWMVKPVLVDGAV